MIQLESFNEWITKTALMHTYERMDALISECLDEQGKPRAPSASAIASARQFLPEPLKNSFKEKRKEQVTR